MAPSSCDTRSATGADETPQGQAVLAAACGARAPWPTTPVATSAPPTARLNQRFRDMGPLFVVPDLWTCRSRGDGDDRFTGRRRGDRDGEDAGRRGVADRADAAGGRGDGGFGGG